MKTILRLSLLVVLTAMLHSCDKVEGPVKEVVPPPAGNRNVLVEDYTGHKCGNCPRASRAIYDLKSVYGDRLIIMAIHAGGFATPFPPAAPYYTYDFRTTAGTELDTDFGISVAGNPNGMVNRRKVNGSYIIASTKWADEASAIFSDASPLPINMEITNSFNTSTRLLQTQVNTEFFKSLTGSYKLCVFMVEDSIVNWQKDYDATPEDVEFYTHREVLRGSMNGTYGAVVTPTNLGDINTLTYSTTLDPSWNENHFSIVAYFYDEATKEIIQVEQKEIVN